MSGPDAHARDLLNGTQVAEKEVKMAVPVTLRDLAVRLTPNPAMTVEGTLQMILDGIERIDDEALARSLAHMNARQAGLAAEPLTDEQWRSGDIQSKLNLIRAARSLKEALREMVK